MAGKVGRKVYRSQRWAVVRRLVLDMGGWRCSKCQRAGRLEVHHIRPVAKGGDWYNPRNLRVLCRPCHFGMHNPVPADRAAWTELIEREVNHAFA